MESGSYAGLKPVYVQPSCGTSINTLLSKPRLAPTLNISSIVAFDATLARVKNQYLQDNNVSQRHVCDAKNSTIASTREHLLKSSGNLLFENSNGLERDLYPYRESSCILEKCKPIWWCSLHILS